MRRATSLWMPLRVVKTPLKRSWFMSLLHYLINLVRPAPLSDPMPSSPTEQWIDKARKSESVDDSDAWMSWIEVCAAYARDHVPMDVGEVRALPQQRAQDGTARYERDWVLKSIIEAKARTVEQAVDE